MKRNTLKLLAIVISISLLTLLFLFTKPQTKTIPLSSLTDSDTIDLKFKNVTLHLEVARTGQKQETGLMNRKTLDENSGMFFVFDKEDFQTFWMKDTLISLDMIFLNKDLKVVNFYKSTLPDQTSTTYSSKELTQYVIETSRGWIDKNNLKIGDNFNY